MNKSNTERKSRVFTDDGDYRQLGRDLQDSLMDEMVGIKVLREFTSKSVTKEEFLIILKWAVHELIGD